MIENCLNIGNINVNAKKVHSCIGGLCGKIIVSNRVTSPIANKCINTGKFYVADALASTLTIYTGNIVGEATSQSILSYSLFTNCYYYNNKAAEYGNIQRISTYNSGNKAVTANEMKDAKNFNKLDFTNVWTISATPVLRNTIKKLTKITIQTNPKKLTYVSGDKVSASGLVLNAYYDDSTVKKISSGYSVTYPSTSTCGTKK